MLAGVFICTPQFLQNDLPPPNERLLVSINPQNIRGEGETKAQQMSGLREKKPELANSTIWL